MTEYKYKHSLTAIFSKPDSSGNVYWAFSFVDFKTGKHIQATVTGGESNIYAVKRYWNVDGWDESILFYTREVSKKEYKRITNDLNYAGCNSEDIVQYIKNELVKES